MPDKTLYEIHVLESDIDGNVVDIEAYSYGKLMEARDAFRQFKKEQEKGNKWLVDKTIQLIKVEQTIIDE